MSVSEPVVLIVDDREENRYTLRHALSRAGFSIIEAATGQQALEMAKQMPEVIVLDVRLPDMLGYEVCRRLRANPRTSHIPVLQLSAAFLTTESKLYALESGADAHLTQPVDPLVLVATVRSLVRLHNAERQSQLAARQWAATFDALSEGVALIDHGVIQRCNRAMTELLHASYSELERTPLSDLLAQHFGLDTASIDGTSPMVVQDKGRFFRLSLCPLPDNDETTGTIFIVADATPQKQAEQALLLNERLAATGRMAHTIAHEINNPLEAITNLIYLAQTSTGLAEEAQAYLASAAAEVQRVSQIARQILSFHREASTPVAVPIAELVNDVLALSARAAVEKGLATRLEMDRTLIVSGYPARLRQAFSNIVRNAIEASQRDGALRVRVSRDAMHRDGRSIPSARITIADQGTGVAAQHRPHVFEAFYTTKAQKGSGVGLWLTLSIIQEHGGKLQLQTSTAEHRHGSVLSVLLPLQ